MFWRRKPLDRPALVAAADRARGRGRPRRAIGLYRQALALAPHDHVVHGKLAPLLARRREKEEALASFATAAAGQLRAGFTDRAISLHRQAVGFFPEELPLWEEVARLQVERGRNADAVAALVAGGRRLHRTRHLVVAERVLRRALEIEPWQPEATELLARTLARDRRKGEALRLLDDLSLRVRGLALRRTRRLAFRLSPTPANLWRWIKVAWRER
jgi:Tfp pilus assembly protein PilF